eukprot:ctg_901.g207
MGTHLLPRAAHRSERYRGCLALGARGGWLHLRQFQSVDRAGSLEGRYGRQAVRLGWRSGECGYESVVPGDEAAGWLDDSRTTPVWRWAAGRAIQLKSATGACDIRAALVTGSNDHGQGRPHRGPGGGMGSGAVATARTLHRPAVGWDATSAGERECAAVDREPDRFLVRGGVDVWTAWCGGCIALPSRTIRPAASYEVMWMCRPCGVEDASRCRRGPYERLAYTIRHQLWPRRAEAFPQLRRLALLHGAHCRDPAVAGAADDRRARRPVGADLPGHPVRRRRRMSGGKRARYGPGVPPRRHGPVRGEHHVMRRGNRGRVYTHCKAVSVTAAISSNICSTRHRAGCGAVDPARRRHIAAPPVVAPAGRIAPSAAGVPRAPPASPTAPRRPHCPSTARAHPPPAPASAARHSPACRSACSTRAASAGRRATRHPSRWVHSVATRCPACLPTPHMTACRVSATRWPPARAPRHPDTESSATRCARAKTGTTRCAACPTPGCTASAWHMREEQVDAWVEGDAGHVVVHQFVHLQARPGRATDVAAFQRGYGGYRALHLRRRQALHLVEGAAVAVLPTHLEHVQTAANGGVLAFEVGGAQHHHVVFADDAWGLVVVGGGALEAADVGRAQRQTGLELVELLSRHHLERVAAQQQHRVSFIWQW